MKVADVMTPGVISITPSASVAAAIALMLRENISALPVVDAKGELVGIVTEGDFLRRAETGTERRRPRWVEFLLGPGRLAEEYVHTHARRIDEIMTTDVITVSADTPLEKAVGLMQHHRIKRLPVLRNGKLVGIVSRADLLRALAAALFSGVSPATSDKALRERITAEIKKQRWVPGSSISCTVKDGIVELSGTIFDQRERQALRVLAENVAGVKKVRDNVAWVDPRSGEVIPLPPNAK